MDKTCKNKTKAKVDKANAKTKSRVKKAVAKVVCALVIAVAFAGCMHPGEQAAKSETMNVTIKDSVIAVNVGAKKSTANCASNTVELAESDRTYDVTILSQAQSLESSGSETFGQTQTPTQDIKPDTNIDVPINKASGAQSVGSVLGDAVVSAVKGVFGKDGTATTATPAAATASTQKSDCTDGSCTPK